MKADEAEMLGICKSMYLVVSLEWRWPIHDKDTKLTSAILEMSPIQLGIHKDHFTGAPHTYGCLQYSLGCCGCSWNSKLVILA